MQKQKASYQVSARQFRPQTFGELVAQSAIVTTLKNALQLQRVGHAYLFCGCHGTGKTTLARLFAKALNCKFLTQENEPCNQCSSCLQILSGQALDVIEIDGASNRSIDDMRQINETIAFLPLQGPFKIYVIDEVHMLTKEAFNSLLKTVEEPPPHIKFLFCTTEPHKLPATILSRCQRFNLGHIPLTEIRKRLLQIVGALGREMESAAAEKLAALADGSLRDALSLLDQVLTFTKEPIQMRILVEALGLPPEELLLSLDQAGAQRDWSQAFKIADKVFFSGYNLTQFLEELIAHFRQLFLIKQGLFEMSNPAYTASSALYRTEQLLDILELLVEGMQSLKQTLSERTALEMLLLRILRTHDQISLESLVARLQGLEAKLHGEVETTVQSTLQAPVVSALDFSKEQLTGESSPTTAPSQQPEPSPERPSAQEQSRFDTIMRFAAKELDGLFKKNTR